MENDAGAARSEAEHEYANDSCTTKNGVNDFFNINLEENLAVDETRPSSIPDSGVAATATSENGHFNTELEGTASSSGEDVGVHDTCKNGEETVGVSSEQWSGEERKERTPTPTMSREVDVAKLLQEVDDMLSSSDDEDEGEGSDHRVLTETAGGNISPLRRKSEMSVQMNAVIRERDTYLQQIANMKDEWAGVREEQQRRVRELEQQLVQREKERDDMKGVVERGEREHATKIQELKTHFSMKVENMQRQVQGAVSEKDRIVMRFASQESKILDAQKHKEALENRLKSEHKEKERITDKLRNANEDRTLLKQRMDGMTSENFRLRKDVDKLKDEQESLTVKLKWTQNKLRLEFESHQESKTALEDTIRKLAEAKEETGQIRKNCQDIIKTYQESDDVRSNNLDIQLKEREKELEEQKERSQSHEQSQSQVLGELEAFQRECERRRREIRELKQEIEQLEQDLEKKENELVICRQTVQTQQGELHTLRNKTDSMQYLQSDLEREKKHVHGLQAEADRLRQRDVELQEMMDVCHKKEAELLEFTEKVSAKNAQIQSENVGLVYKVKMLEEQVKRHEEMFVKEKSRTDQLLTELREKCCNQQEEIETLKKSLEEKILAVKHLTVSVEDEVNANKVLKRKHAASLKDLSRQLNLSQKRLELCENRVNLESHDSGGHDDTTSVASLPSSAASLENMLEAPPPHAGDCVSNAYVSTSPTAYTHYHDPEPVTAAYGHIHVDKQLLIEKIVRLQRALAKKNDKMDFFQEHINQLTDNIKRKTRLMQLYICQQETGALSSSAMDSNKAELSRKSGSIMASIYNQHVSDSHMSLELSLEINSKLQAVLEDTLLTNITLKENIDTLGTEIARLSQENRSIKLSRIS